MRTVIFQLLNLTVQWRRLLHFVLTHWHADTHHILSGIIIIIIIEYINKAMGVILIYYFESVSTAHISGVEATCYVSGSFFFFFPGLYLYFTFCSPFPFLTLLNP